MRILLDENFPLGLLRALRADGRTADHIITLGWRGASDRTIRERAGTDDVIFLTQDVEFLARDVSPFAVVLVSRVRQSRPIQDHIAVWQRAVRDLLATPESAGVFELSDDGEVLPVKPSR